MNEPSPTLCAARLATHIRREPVDQRREKFAEIASMLMLSYGEQAPPDAPFEHMVRHIDTILDAVSEMVERPEASSVSGTA